MADQQAGGQASPGHHARRPPGATSKTAREPPICAGGSAFARIGFLGQNGLIWAVCGWGAQGA